MNNTAHTTLSPEHAGPIIALPSVMTIATAPALAGQLRALAFIPSVVLTLDASATEILTAPAAQLLLSLDKTLTAGGGRLALLHVRESVAEALHVLGLEAQLSKWSAAHA